MMTQTEYENPDRPAKRLPIGSVVIERFRMWEYRTTWAGELVTLRRYDVQWDDTWLSYRTKPGSDVLYTMDGDGNIKSPSVFREPLGLTDGKI